MTNRTNARVPKASANTRPILAAIAAVVICAATLRGASVVVELKPTDAVAGKISAGGFAFEIGSRSEAGAVIFRVAITESQGRFTDDVPSVFLGRFIERSGPDGTLSQDTIPVRTLKAQRTGQSAICEFSVSLDALKDPDTSFWFINPTVVVIDGQRQRMPSQHIFVARLSGFDVKRLPKFDLLD